MDSEFIQLPKGDAEALIELYNGMLEAGQSGVGYSPRTAEAFKKLHANHPVGIKLPPHESTALELGAAVRRLGLA